MWPVIAQCKLGWAAHSFGPLSLCLASILAHVDESTGLKRRKKRVISTFLWCPIGVWMIGPISMHACHGHISLQGELCWLVVVFFVGLMYHTLPVS